MNFTNFGKLKEEKALVVKQELTKFYFFLTVFCCIELAFSTNN